MHPTRLAIELTTMADVEPSLVAVNDLLLERGLTTQRELAARHAVMGNWPWTLNTGIVLRFGRSHD